MFGPPRHKARERQAERTVADVRRERARHRLRQYDEMNRTQQEERPADVNELVDIAELERMLKRVFGRSEAEESADHWAKKYNKDSRHRRLMQYGQWSKDVFVPLQTDLRQAVDAVVRGNFEHM